MRVRDNVELSTAVAGALIPSFGASVLARWLASVLIDADHLTWRRISKFSLDPIAALRYFGGAPHARHARTHRLHSLGAAVAFVALGLRWWPAWMIARGRLLHDTPAVHHGARVDDALRLALERDELSSRRRCVSRADMVAPVWRQPILMPSYDIDTFVSLCPVCHEEALAYDSAVSTYLPVSRNFRYPSRSTTGADLNGTHSKQISLAA